MSQYPRDEFDKVPENSSRQGVHRSSIEPVRRGLGPLLAFGIVALIIGALAFTVLPKLNFGNASGSGPVASSHAPASPSSTAPQTTATAASSAPATSAAPETSPAPTTTAAPGVDKTTPVSVLNASGVVGLAAKYAATVTADGWTVSQTANWAGAAQPSSVIFYNGAAQKANAEELGTLLGITRMVDTADLQIPLAVVLGPGAK